MIMIRFKLICSLRIWPQGGSLTSFQCWTVGTIFTSGRSQLFSPDNLRLMAVAEAVESKFFKACHKSVDQSKLVILILDLKTAVH